MFHLCGTSSPSKHRSHRPKPPRTDVARDCHCKLLSCSLVQGSKICPRAAADWARRGSRGAFGSLCHRADMEYTYPTLPRPHPPVLLDPSQPIPSHPRPVTTPHISSLRLASIHLAVTGLSLQHDIFPARHPAITLLSTHRTKAPPYFPPRRIPAPTDDFCAITQPEQAFRSRNRPEPVCPT